jgi:hypothetical protein
VQTNVTLECSLEELGRVKGGLPDGTDGRTKWLANGTTDAGACGGGPVRALG